MLEQKKSIRDTILERFGASVNTSEFPICPVCHRQEWSKLVSPHNKCMDCVEKSNKNVNNKISKTNENKPEIKNPDYFFD